MRKYSKCLVYLATNLALFLQCMRSILLITPGLISMTVRCFGRLNIWCIDSKQNCDTVFSSPEWFILSSDLAAPCKFPRGLFVRACTTLSTSFGLVTYTRGVRNADSDPQICRWLVDSKGWLGERAVEGCRLGTWNYPCSGAGFISY